MTQRVLVTGATGFIGRQLCACLKQDGHEVTALGRQQKEGPWDRFVTGDLGGIITTDLCHGMDVVYHLAGIAHAMKLSRSQEDVYQRVNVDGTRHLLELIRESEVKSLVYFSSIKAMAEISGDGEACVNETFTDPPSDPYGLSKLKSEQAVLDFGRQYNFHVSCLRPTLVYGPNPKGNILRMMNAIARGRFPALPDFYNKRSMISVYDLIDAAILAAYDPNANRQTYIVSDGQDYSTRQVYELMSKAMGRSISKFNWPVWPFKLMAKAGDVVSSLTGKPAPFSSETWRRLHGSACYKSDKLRNDLGWKPKDTLESVLPAMVESLQSK